MSRHAARTRSSSDRTSLYDEITTKIIGELEAGRVPWVQPWGTVAAKAPLAMPKNAATGRNYSGRKAHAWSGNTTRRSPLGRRARCSSGIA
jgi:antirestriction protein ArdC